MSSKDFVSKIKLNIGDIVVSLSSANSSQKFRLASPYREFVSNGSDVTSELKVHFEIPVVDFGTEIFNSGGWGLYAKNGLRIFKLAPSLFGPLPIKLGIFRSDFAEGDIYIRDDYVERFNGDSNIHPFPFSYPLDEIVVHNILSRKLGLTVHACGINSNGKGYLFVGSSGVGKSVTANLWAREKTAQILSDDRIIIRLEKDQLFAYGTPWHGDAELFSPQKVQLERIFFLKQAAGNEVKRLSVVDASSRLFVCSFPTFYDQVGMKNTLDLINVVATEIECFELGFVPKISLIDFLRSQELVS